MPAAKYVMKLLAADRISKVLKKVQGNISKFNKKSRFNFQRLAGPMKAAGLAAVAFGGLAINSFRKFEQGVINVKKVTGLQFGVVSNMIDDLSSRMPVATGNLLEIAGAAGQLGIKGKDNIAKFTETFAKLELATNVAGEEGAKQIARILTVTGEGVQTIDRFGAALVDLGNNTAAAEKEILTVATKVSGAVSRFGVGGADVLGMSAALKGLGRNAEEVGGVMGRTFGAINQALINGGNGMEQLERITQKTGAELKVQFKKNATSVFKDFINGLAKIKKENGNVTNALKIMGLTGIRVDATLGTLINRNNILTQSLSRAGKAYKENTALNKEYDQQVLSVNAKITGLKNAFGKLTKNVGVKLAPSFKGVVTGLTEFTNSIADVVSGTKQLDEVFGDKIANNFRVIGDVAEWAGEKLGGYAFRVKEVLRIQQEMRDVQKDIREKKDRDIIQNYADPLKMSVPETQKKKDVEAAKQTIELLIRSVEGFDFDLLKKPDNLKLGFVGGGRQF